MGSEWFALGVPVFCCVVMLVVFGRKIVWWELALPTAVAAIAILIFKWAAYRWAIADTEYRGSVIVSARYYEYWETYVKRTCTRTTCTGSGKSRTCVTTFYDCSYCDHNAARWVAYDNYGREYPISEAYYNQLRTRWKAVPKFVELNRAITYNGGCGQDGDAYDIVWDGNPYSADAAVTEHSYKNYVQASHSAFKMPYVSRKEAAQLGLYQYPDIYYPYKQPAILGLEGVKMPQTAKDSAFVFYEYFNGYYGTKNHVKTFILLFQDKPIDISFKQEYYWDGGNDNELVIAIGYESRTNRLLWVRPFGWTDEKRVFVDVREDLMAVGVLDLNRFCAPIQEAIEKHWRPKNFEDFNYLHIDITITQMVWLYVITVLVSVGACVYCVTNDFVNEQA